MVYTIQSHYIFRGGRLLGIIRYLLLTENEETKCLESDGYFY